MHSLNELRGIFIDAGGTLFRAKPSVGEIYSNVTRKFGVEVDPKKLYKLYADSFYQAIKKWGNMPTSDELDRKMWQEITLAVYEQLPELKCVDFQRWFEELYETFGQPDVWELFDDVMPTLVKLKQQGYVMAIVSNWDTRLRKILNGLGLMDIFQYVIISAEAGFRKPDTRIFEKALEVAGLVPEHTIHIGDIYEEDIKGALSAGLKAVLVAKKQPPGRRDNYWIINRLSQILEILGKL